MARKADPAAPAKANRRATKEAPKPASNPARAPAAAPQLPRWPVWIAVAMTAIYLVVHLGKIPLSLQIWEGTFSALFLGK